ncbi:hypothetical protein ATJ78_2386 [Paramicrobacterium agarici]|uniref:Uncharacterized protein n=1 Tax=Paramicrobacterium agarici TaxID=630514 RepID=A0A2A9DZS2_9MICO|nr:hypothetical protein ATJ78_2386 [Microbacterium agarici]
MRWRDTRDFARLSAIVYGFAGIVVPVLGWLVGLAMLMTSPRWSSREKVVAAGVPTTLTLVAALATAVASATEATPERLAVVVHLPSGYDVAWFGAVVVLIVTASIGLRLMLAIRD